MDDFKSNLLVLIIIRLMLVSLVLGFATFALSQQVSFFEFLQPFILAVYILSVLYMLLWKYSNRPNLTYYVQFFFDLILISLLIFISGGINSLFTPFYVLIIVYASLLKRRDGGVIALTLSITSYSGIVHLSYLGWVPGAEDLGPYPLIIYRISLNTLGFMGVAMLGIYLSERLQSARRELGAAKVVHQSIVDSIRDGLITLDQEGYITSSNRAAEEICGYSQRELLSKSFSELFSRSVLDRILGSDFDVNPRALHIECWTTNKVAETLFVGMSCSPLNSDEPKQTGYIVSLQDLTEIKKREEEVQLKEKMTAMGEMAAGLAHEIRNPLGSLSGSIQVLQSELQLSDEKVRLLDIIKRECNRLNNIVGDFLDYAGSRPTHPEAVDLLTLVQDTVDLFKNSPEFQGDYSIEILPSPEPIRCVADSDQFQQVIWNILQNGVQAMPQGGQLLIHLRQEKSRALLTFHDQGMGMSREEKKELFQPFRSGFRKGTGLGMAIVYQIIQQHHGSIDVLSERNSGTTINISLPIVH
ncbi:ATP-binding protein [Acidobacteria bacterium AH-259-D05]|nr:ATP-binding protein [Acidobacteria bacterium AH-259-D05]